MRTYLVPFQEEEIVWVEYNAKVEANSKEEAFSRIKQIIEDDDYPHREYDCENLGIVEHIESNSKFFMDDVSIDDVQIEDDRLSCEISHTAFDVTRLGKDALYSEVEDIFLRIGINIEVIKMDMIPIRIKEHSVTYKCIPTEHKITFTDDTFVHWKDGVKIDQKIKEDETLVDLDINVDDLEITPLLISKNCNYDRRTIIRLNDTFSAAQLDEKLCNNKSDVVKYNGETYICGILDDGYALWKCEI